MKNYDDEFQEKKLASYRQANAITHLIYLIGRKQTQQPRPLCICYRMDEVFQLYRHHNLYRHIPPPYATLFMLINQERKLCARREMWKTRLLAMP